MEQTIRYLSVRFLIFQLFWKQRLRKEFLSPPLSIYVSICLYLILFKVLWCVGYLLMDELRQAVAPFLGAPGGGMGGSSGNMGGGGGGYGPFDLGVVAKENDEEVVHNPKPAFNYALPEPNQDSVRSVIRDRVLIQRLGKKNMVVADEEVDKIINLKNAIADRMVELDQSSFWDVHRNRIVRDYILTNKGEEYIIPSLEGKLQSLFGDSPRGTFYDHLQKMKKSFYQEAPFRGPRGD